MFSNFGGHRSSGGIMKSRSSRAPKQFKGRTRPNVPLSSKFKTKMCHYLSQQGSCLFGEHCTYAHSKEELRFIERHLKHKALPCRDFSTEGLLMEQCGFILYKSDPDAKSLSSSFTTDESEQLLETTHNLMTQNAAFDFTSEKMTSEKRAMMDFLRPDTPSSGYAGSLLRLFSFVVLISMMVQQTNAHVYDVYTIAAVANRGAMAPWGATGLFWGATGKCRECEYDSQTDHRGPPCSA